MNEERQFDNRQEQAAREELLTRVRTQHTPGEWHLVRHGENESEAYNVDAVSNCGDAVTLAVVQHAGMDWEEFEANACLIAAAPLMADYVILKAKEGDADAEKIARSFGWEPA